jgi:hypothetical protein
MNAETQMLIAKFYLGENRPRDYSDWAVSCLEKGLDTKHLRILASMFDVDSFSEIERDFRKSLAELGWNFPLKEDSLLIDYSRLIAKQIVENKIEPYTGCRQIYLLFYELNGCEQLRNWMWLKEGTEPETYEFLWDSCAESEPTQALKDAIINEANELLKDDYFSRQLKRTTDKILLNADKKQSLFSKVWMKLFK